MNNEIKEILEDNDELMVRYKDNSFECFDTLPKNVLDYITNLQQDYDNETEENLKLSEWLVEKQQRIQGLEAENETLSNDFKNQVEYTNKIAEENERLKEQINQYENPDDMTLFYMWLDAKAKDKIKALQQEKEDYKSRCEKGIEYIHKNYYEIVYKTKGTLENDLLNILQNGSDDNE